MAINSEEKAAKARELLAKLQSATDLMPEEAERTNANIDRLRASLGEYEQASRPVDQTGRLTADVPGYEQKEENLEDGGFFYEPSVDSVKERLRSDPSLSQRLNLQSWTSSPDQIERLNERDTAYTAVADDDFKAADEQARQGKKKLTRYSKVKLSEDPLSKATGFVGKHLPAFATGVTEAINPFQESSAIKTGQFFDQLNDSNGKKTDYAQQYKNTRASAVDASPIAEVVGTFAGAASPVSVGSMAAEGAMKAGNYAARSPIGKAVIGGVGGALGSVAEGELQAANQELSQEDPELQNYFDGILERVTGNAVFGAGLGAGGDIVSQGAKAGSESLRNFSPAVKGLRELENAGGNLKMPMGPGSVLSPVKVPDEIMENFRASSADGEILSPLEIAANKVGPQIAESVDQQAQQAYRQAGENLEKYHNSPQGLAAKRVTKPARVMLEMIREGQNVGDLGTVGDAVPKVAKKLRERLMNEVERKEVSIDEYDRLKAQYGDDIIELDPADADKILGSSKQEQVQASVQPKTSVTQIDDIVPEPVNPFDPPAKNISPEATADTIPAPAIEPVVDARDVGTVPPKGKQKKADGKVAGKADRDVTPTKLYENSNQARNEYGQKMRPYREAMRASDIKTGNLMDEFPYVENADPISIKPSELETARTELPERPPLPESDVENISQSDVQEIYSSSPDESKTGVSTGSKTVLVPRARNSRQIEKIQQDIAEDLQGISKDSDWLKKVDKAFRETRDQFEPNDFTPGEMTLDDGTKVTGLSALQRQHHELFQKIEEMKADTSSKSKTAVLNKIKAFASGQNGTADKELLEQAKKLGLEKELRQVAATRVVPGLKTAGSPLENEKGIFTGLKNAGIQRVLPILEAVGNVPGNPFIAAPNTPAARIQKYLFENAAKNLLNFEGGRLGRFGNEVNDLREKDK